MAKYLVETYYTCSFKVNHYLDDINETELENLVKRQKEERDLLLVMQQAQKEEECRLVHEAERLKLLEDRMKGATASGAQPMGSASD